MNYYNKFNKQQKGGNYERIYLKTTYIDENGEILDPTFKDEYRFKFLETYKNEINGTITTTRIVQLIERKCKQQTIDFDTTI